MKNVCEKLRNWSILNYQGGIITNFKFPQGWGQSKKFQPVKTVANYFDRENWGYTLEPLSIIIS